MINDLPLGMQSPAQTGLAPRFLRTDYGHQKRPKVACTHAFFYGLTCDEYEAMRDRSADRCELCGRLDRDTPRGELVIDHFEGGRRVRFVRGLLCDRCNSVMQRHDGRSPWGPASLPYAHQARAYHLAAFGQPGVEAFKRADEVIAEQMAHLAAIYRRLNYPPPSGLYRLPS
ncbi:Recombination endonuclease VII [Actinobacteria bacterium OV450]|nr:Recombination endonuclease VII [Actinobacteria bacterium OV450]